MSTAARRSARSRFSLPHPDRVIEEIDNALRTLFAPAHSAREIPGEQLGTQPLSKDDARQSAQLMRVNHSGEVAAQALYRGQMAVARNHKVKALLHKAAREETEHLAWTEQRLAELGARTSVLNPVWYANSFALGVLSGLLGDRWNLGFLAETERQVEQHLERHLQRLPADDARSRAIVEQMQADEAAHAVNARRRGAAALPAPVRNIMRLGSRIMTGTSHWI